MSERLDGRRAPLHKPTSAPVASRDGGASVTKKLDSETYIPISLLDKWRLLQEIFTYPSLSSTAKIVAGVLLDFLNCKTGKCNPSLARIEPRIGRGRRVISAAVCQLVATGWLSCKRRRGSSSYRFAFERLQDDVQKPESHKPEDVQETSCLAAQDSVHEDMQKTAHLNTGNVESGNGSWRAVSAGQPSSVRAAKGKRKKQRTRQTPLAEEWQPSECYVEYAIQCGLSEDAIPSEVEKFKNHYIAKGTTMLDWDRAWQNWCIRAVEYADARRITNAHSNRSLVAGLLSADPPRQWGRS